MKIEEIQAKRRRNEEAQDELLLSGKKHDYQMDQAGQSYTLDRRLKEETRTYFYGESEQYLFEDGIEGNRHGERSFFEGSESISNYISKEKERLIKENEELYEQELNELREEGTDGKDEFK